MSTALLNPAADPAERAKGIGGSDIPAILGLSPYKAPLDVYLEKRGLWSDEAESEAAHWGNVMEPVLAREYVRRYASGEECLIRFFPQMRANGVLYVHDGKVEDEEYVGRFSSLLGTLVHPNYPWARGHVDGVALTGYAGNPTHVCEFKTADSRLSGYWGEPDTDQVPEFYLAQVMWYLMLADLEVAHLAVLIGGNRFQRYIIPRNQDLIDVMLERAEDFWHRVETQDPPDPEPGERGKESLSRMYPKGSQGKELEATPHLVEAAKRLHALREELKLNEEVKSTTENGIKQLMADAARLNLGPRSYISWANVKDSSKVDWEEIARSLGATPELIREHTQIVPGHRRFLCQGLEKLFNA